MIQGPYRLVAEEGKAKCSWVNLDDMSNILVRGSLLSSFFLLKYLLRIVKDILRLYGTC